MPKLWKRLTSPKVEPYEFPQADGLEPRAAAPQPEPEEPPEEQSAEPERQEPSLDTGPLHYAQVQADRLLEQAQRQADELLEQARARAQEEAELLRTRAQEEGWSAGHAEGMRQGTAQALEEGGREREEKLRALTAEVEQFLSRADGALERQMDQNIGEMRDLAIAVAEKVIAVSLKSSSEVIGRMIQAAVDRRKRREWVRIYVAECDGQSMKLSPGLASALEGLSDQVRIIPIADDEPGTCIIEMPDEIVDASAATQVNNIRAMLSDIPASDDKGQFILRGGGIGHVPPHDPAGI